MLNAAALFLLLLTGLQLNLKGTLPSPGQKTDVPQIDVQRGHVPTFPRVIRGRVTDAEGKPIAGALIEWGPSYPPDAPPETTSSRDDGNYRLEIRKVGGHFKLGISAAGCCPTWRANLIPGPESAPTELDVQLQPESTIGISLVSESCTPIPSLEIVPMTPQSGFNSSFSSVQQPEPIPGHRNPTRCNDQGICTLKQLLPAPEALQVIVEADTKPQQDFKKRKNAEGWISLRIEQNGNWIQEYEISREEYFESNGHVRIVVPDFRNPLVRQTWNGIIHGQVSDADGNPVTDYQFTVRYKAETNQVNDPEGQFAWGKMLDPNRSQQIRIFAQGFAPSVSDISPTIGDPVHYRIRLKPARSAEFQLVDARTQNPVPDAPVVTGISKRDGWNYVEWNSLDFYADGHHGLVDVLHAVSDANGRLTIPEGKEPATLIILTPGYGRAIITPEQRPEPDDDGIVRIGLVPAATIHATRAANSRIGQESDRIYLERESSESFREMFHSLRLNEQDECLIDSLSPGRYHVGLFHSDGSSSTACWLKVIELKAGERLELPLGEMPGTLTVSGRTTPFTDVSLKRKLDVENGNRRNSDLTFVATLSDIDGYFELNGLDADTYGVELGRLSGRDGMIRRFVGSTPKGPSQLLLKSDTHIDWMTGTVEPPESVVSVPATKGQ